MKTTLKALMAAALATLLLLTVACGGETNTPAGADASIAGDWILPDSMVEGTLEAYVFDKDGETFHLYQLTKDYVITNTIDGTYKTEKVADSGEEGVEVAQLTITMMGHPLVYTYELTDENTLTLYDHGTETVLTRSPEALKTK